ncbi:CDK5 regulatory subunit-associated protein 3-like [Pecten maximus]|uniref:CDK5 regulatory subunit-associated protein 3-like n=1 Tax=Pecten maximus TaxID=6579 RepID=UPI001458278D|nr:CDK5 regulatory subunit-associated protein 3-like [Pecten maximus]XP_033733351.1 CDK5 regulatory subunit-associated protein 3-like [Pecten maximus]XP_033733353.1 CDK5 regulatory subunit-associated protein 3-like [Pecten maximus]
MATSQNQTSAAENIPIDIHFNKLLDWLINRRHCDKEWHTAMTVIRKKINQAIQDMPAMEEITQLLEGTYVNYFHCLKIVEILKDSESGKKNMFGQYSSQKMKDWVEIIRLYEKDGVYLGETAQMIGRNVNYEVPALKKQIAKCQQAQKECDKKEADYVAKAAELRKKYNSRCKELGIEGSKIKSELSALVKDLPVTFNKIADSAKDIQEAVQFYGDFVNFVMDSQKHQETCLPMLKHVQEFGDTTTYEWKTGTKPEKIVEASILINLDDEQDQLDSAENIDWDIGADIEADIDFGDDVNFDISEITIEQGGTEAGDQTPVEQDSDSNGIDWSDTVLVEHPNKDGSEEGVAKGVDALTILDNPVTRTKFMDDLMELEAFLTQRICEMEGSGDSDIVSTSQFQNAPSSVQVEKSKVVSMTSKVKDILGQLTSVKMHHLLLIRNSPRYVDRLKDSLKQTLSLADKMVFYEKEMVVKKKDVLEEQRQLEPKLDVIVQRTKDIQRQMEQEISSKYKNRPVNIMGEINMI